MKREIEAKEGTFVYEAFQITDFQGGSRTSALNGNSYKIFPFCQYYIQNIEVPIKINKGAIEYLYSGLYASTNAEVNKLPFIGTSSSMFNISSGYIEKSYDKIADRLVFRMNGNASISDFSVTISISVNTANYHLPLTNNITCYIESGKTTVNSNLLMNADAKVIIKEGATVDIASGKSLFIYDSDDWMSGFVFDKKKLAPLRYTIPFATTNGTSSGTPIRTDEKIVDAAIQVDGTLNVIGKIYTSPGNANIYSSACGKVIFSNSVTEATTIVYHLNEISGSSFMASISSTYSTTMLPAKLHNGDDSYIATAGSAAGDQFVYSKNAEKWMKNPKTITWNANGGTTDASVMAYSEGAFLGELPAAYRDGYTLDGWFTAASGGTQISQTTKVTATTTYYAHWTAKVFNIDYKDQGKAAFSGTHVDNPSLHPTTHTYGTATTLNDATKPGNIFGGWHTISNCKDASHVTSLDATAYDADITLYAKWTPIDYTIAYTAPTNGNYTISVDGGTASATDKTANYGQTVTLSATPDPGYVLASWTVTKEGGGTVTVTGNQFTMPDDNVTITANFAVDAYYTITIKASPAGYGSVSEETISSVPYGSTVTIEGNTLTIEGPCQ